MPCHTPYHWQSTWKRYSLGLWILLASSCRCFRLSIRSHRLSDLTSRGGSYLGPNQTACDRRSWTFGGRPGSWQLWASPQNMWAASPSWVGALCQSCSGDTKRSRYSHLRYIGQHLFDEWSFPQFSAFSRRNLR